MYHVVFNTLAGKFEVIEAAETTKSYHYKGPKGFAGWIAYMMNKGVQTGRYLEKSINERPPTFKVKGIKVEAIIPPFSDEVAAKAYYDLLVAQGEENARLKAQIIKAGIEAELNKTA